MSSPAPTRGRVGAAAEELQRVDRPTARKTVPHRLLRFRYRTDVRPDHGLAEGLLRAEMVVHECRADAGVARDVAHRGGYVTLLVKSRLAAAMIAASPGSTDAKRAVRFRGRAAVSPGCITCCSLYAAADAISHDPTGFRIAAYSTPPRSDRSSALP